MEVIDLITAVLILFLSLVRIDELPFCFGLLWEKKWSNLQLSTWPNDIQQSRAKVQALLFTGFVYSLLFWPFVQNWCGSASNRGTDCKSARCIPGASTVLPPGRMYVYPRSLSDTSKPLNLTSGSSSSRSCLGFLWNRPLSMAPLVLSAVGSLSCLPSWNNWRLSSDRTNCTCRNSYPAESKGWMKAVLLVLWHLLPLKFLFFRSKECTDGLGRAVSMPL